MKRWLFNGLIVLLLSICVVTAVGWAPSYWKGAAVIGSHFTVTLDEGNVLVGIGDTGFSDFSVMSLPQFSIRDHMEHYWFGFGYTVQPLSSSTWRAICVPIYCILTVELCVLVLLWRSRVGARLLKENHCTNCGYDLRATPERCPECGTIPIKPIEAKL